VNTGSRAKSSASKSGSSSSAMASAAIVAVASSGAPMRCLHVRSYTVFWLPVA
jgi:ribonuclease PH